MVTQPLEKSTCNSEGERSLARTRLTPSLLPWTGLAAAAEKLANNRHSTNAEKIPFFKRPVFKRNHGLSFAFQLLSVAFPTFAFLLLSVAFPRQEGGNQQEQDNDAEPGRVGSGEEACHCRGRRRTGGWPAGEQVDYADYCQQGEGGNDAVQLFGLGKTQQLSPEKLWPVHLFTPFHSQPAAGVGIFLEKDVAERIFF